MQNYDMDQIRYHTDKIRYMSSKCEFVLKGVDYVGIDTPTFFDSAVILIPITRSLVIAPCRSE